mmetsp:Transcript_82598/g.252425  ORF Transcript_82598/g.252425 Transcript_82598/m.252425 type:complete len:203 (-) Transcript_82598:1305-1913(-)
MFLKCTKDSVTVTAALRRITSTEKRTTGMAIPCEDPTYSFTKAASGGNTSIRGKDVMLMYDHHVQGHTISASGPPCSHPTVGRKVKLNVPTVKSKMFAKTSPRTNWADGCAKRRQWALMGVPSEWNMDGPVPVIMAPKSSLQCPCPSYDPLAMCLYSHMTQPICAFSNQYRRCKASASITQQVSESNGYTCRRLASARRLRA